MDESGLEYPDDDMDRMLDDELEVRSNPIFNLTFYDQPLRNGFRDITGGGNFSFFIKLQCRTPKRS